MASDKRHSFSIFVTKFLCVLFLVLPESNLVICDDLEDDSLKYALEAVERRQKDLELQDNEYYGQPENIGYGFQKTLGFFDNGPARELGSYDSNPKNDKNLQNLFLAYGNNIRDEDFGGFDNRKSNFRERMSKNDYLINEKDASGEEYDPSSSEYLQLLKNLWSKYLEEKGEDINLEDLTNEQVEEILSGLRGREDGLVGGDYSAPDTNGYEVVPVRKRKNYRVFEGLEDRRKRYPSFGQGFYGKRNPYSQNLNYDVPPENDFLYSLKYVNPEYNREAVENLRDEGYDVLGEEKDRDIMRILDNTMNRPRYDADVEGPYWPREESDEEVWMPGPITFSNDGYEGLDRGEKRSDLTPRFFKPHNGIHLNTKRFPVKRSANLNVKKEDTKNEKVPQEVKNIFATTVSTTVPPKKGTQKKPTEVLKKQNVTKPEVTKHPEAKKVVRRSGKYAKEQFVPAQGNEEIANIFSGNRKAISKKAIDWSQYFGIDKRSPQAWLKDDSVQRAEKHFMAPKSKRFLNERANLGNVNYLDHSQYEIPFDTRLLNKKNYGYDIGANIDKVENKIGDIEEKLIDDAVKYTGAHSGGSNEDLNKVKNKVIQHLEAAYSLEKMKNALEEFKSLVKPVRNSAVEEIVKKTSTVAPITATTAPKENLNLENLNPVAEKKPAADTTKRVAIKKEGVKEFFNQDSADDLVEFLGDGSYPNNQYDNEACPLLDKILNTCLRVEETGGRYAELLVPLCALQQICYYCGAEIGVSKISTCDALYLNEAENVCQGRSECLIGARDSMLAIQDLYELEVIKDHGRPNSYGSCLANTCIQKYFYSSPGAIYPLEAQN